METQISSRISKVNEGNGTTVLSWKKPDVGPLRYFIGLFLLAWLGGWFMGFKSVIGQILNPQTPGEINFFLIFWLVGWSTGGVFAIAIAYLMLKPQKPEKLIMSLNGLEYDSGTSSPVSTMMSLKNKNSKPNPMTLFGLLFRSRVVIKDIRRGELKFSLDKNPHRLYFDKNMRRIDIGAGLEEPELEYLYRELEPWSAR